MVFGVWSPLLVIDYEYDADNKQQIVKLEQIQDKTTTPIHRLSFYIDVYENGVPKRHLVEMNSHQQDYYFDVKKNHQCYCRCRTRFISRNF